MIDLKTGRFTHADAGQMHVYLNYAREHWTLPGENPPVGLILCAEKDAAVAHYALENLPNKVLAAEYRMTLPAGRRDPANPRAAPTRQWQEAHEPTMSVEVPPGWQAARIEDQGLRSIGNQTLEGSSEWPFDRP